MGIQKIFYGKSDLIIKKIIDEGELKISYLKLMKPGGLNKICEIVISKYVYKYLEDILSKVPEESNSVFRCYVCFSSVMEKKQFIKSNGLEGYSYSCALKDSRLIVIEKANC